MIPLGYRKLRSKQSHGELQHIVGDQSYQPPANFRSGATNVQSNRVRSDTNTSRVSTSRYIRPTIRNLHVVSTPHFYKSVDESDIKQPATSTRKLRQSKHLPGWIWKIITSVLGINESKKWLATALYVLTLFSALVFTFLGVLFVVFDVSSKNSGTTIHIGAISLVIGFGWLSLGIYSFRLAGRLFGDKDFAASVRRHSRTVFKISSAFLLILCGLGFAALNLYNAYEDYSAEHCHLIGLHHMICHSMFVSRTVFTSLAYLWNVMVGCMLLSVCRTHTIGIRRFICDLEQDGKKYEDYWRDKLQNSKEGEYRDMSSILSNHEWFVIQENDHILEDLIQQSNAVSRAAVEDNNSDDAIVQREIEENQTRVEPEISPAHVPAQAARTSGDDDNSGTEQQDDPLIMTEDEILLCYWKISSRMRFTSQCLQRWLASWVAFVGIWVTDYVIYWLSHSPDIPDILEFFLPMLLILVLASGYAEANGEGQTMIRCICPTKERYGMLNFLYQQPLQMQVFSLSISYSAILTVILAFAVAFSSRLILDEVMKP